MEENFIPQFKKIFENSRWPSHYQLFLCRNDGVILYKNASLDNNLDSHSIGALIGGVWQAARSLSDFIPGPELEDGYRLSFDTSSQGVYILPFSLKGTEYYLGAIYRDEQNPAKIKNIMRSKIFDLEKHFSNSSDAEQIGDDKQYLFKNISDQEMDDIFNIYS
ncbi:MAG: hypothetical protein ACO20H_00860 [Bacteriovoracaceae bacterium]